MLTLGLDIQERETHLHEFKNKVLSDVYQPVYLKLDMMTDMATLSILIPV